MYPVGSCPLSSLSPCIVVILFLRSMSVQTCHRKPRRQPTNPEGDSKTAARQLKTCFASGRLVDSLASGKRASEPACWFASRKPDIARELS